MKILLTAFEPFGGSAINATLEVIRQVQEQPGVTLVKLTVPVSFQTSVQMVADCMRRERPDAVVCLGQAGGRCAITPERVAINMDDASIPDNDGDQPVDLPIHEDGAPAYFSTLPIKAMVRAIKEAGIPAHISNTADTYVCNHLMYGVLYAIDHEFPGMKGGFIHVPFIPQQVVEQQLTTASLSASDTARAIEVALRVIAASSSVAGINDTQKFNQLW